MGWERYRLPRCPHCVELRALLWDARPHVFRQQTAGTHEQDRADAEALYPRLWDLLKDHPR